MLGVDLFFVLSGFLITSLLLGEHERRGSVDLVAFARRRLLRLVPALVGLLLVVLALAVGGWLYAVDDVTATFGWTLSFTANWAMLADRPVVVGHLWTVAIEGQFYLVWALAVVAALRLRRSHGWLAAAAVAGIVAVALWRYAEVERGAALFDLYIGTLTRFDAPLVGALAGAALAAGRFDRLRGRPAAALSVAGLLVVVTGAVVLDPLDPVLYRGLFTVVAIGAAAAVVGAVQAGDGALVRVLGARPLVLAGMVSYSLYLWHLPLFDWLARETPGWSPPLRSAVGVVVAVVVAGASYLFVERPFLRRRHRRAA